VETKQNSSKIQTIHKIILAPLFFGVLGSTVLIYKILKR